LPERSLLPLSFCNLGDKVSIARIGNQNTDFLKFAEDNGLLLGTTIQVANKNKIADSITIISKGEEIVLGLAAAGRIEVEYA
jgi:Fe2+ transport system protein FeoA